MIDEPHFDGVAGLYRRLSRDVPDGYCELLRHNLGLGRGSRLLELGCGTGELAIRLASQGVEVTALDVSSEMLNVACRFPGADAVTWVHESTEGFPFETQRFDAVFSYESFHLFPDAYTLVRRIGEGLVPGGRLGIGWRIASWEEQFKDLIVSTFAAFDISLSDWEYSKCHAFHDWTEASGLFELPVRLEVAVPSCDTIDDATSLLSSIARTSVLDERDRRTLSQRLRQGFTAAGEEQLRGATTHGMKLAIRLDQGPPA